MAKRENERRLQEQVKDVAVDVRNEVIVQTANLYLLARKILLVSLGAIALSAEETAEFMERLVERGEMAEADLQKLITEFRERGKSHEEEFSKMSQDTFRRAGDALEERVESILVQLNVPTKSDIEELSAKITILNERVSALRERDAQIE